jgi:hypothetical protein
VALDVDQGFWVDEGAHEEALVIEGNWIRTPGTAIRLVQGPAILRNNILQGDGTAWELGLPEQVLESILLLGNSFVVPGESAFVLSGVATQLHFANNLSLVALPQPAGGRFEANTVCASSAACWEDAQGSAFYPPEGAEGIASGVPNPDLEEDFCGRERAALPSLGALEPACKGEPSTYDADFKSTFVCTFAQVGDDDCDEVEDTGTPEPEPEGPCGCVSGEGNGGWFLGFALLFWRRRTISST